MVRQPAEQHGVGQPIAAPHQDQHKTQQYNTNASSNLHAVRNTTPRQADWHPISSQQELLNDGSMSQSMFAGALTDSRQTRGAVQQQQQHMAQANVRAQQGAP